MHLRGPKAILELKRIFDRLHGKERVQTLGALGVETPLDMQRMPRSTGNTRLDETARHPRPREIDLGTGKETAEEGEPLRGLRAFPPLLRNHWPALSVWVEAEPFRR